MDLETTLAAEEAQRSSQQLGSGNLSVSSSGNAGSSQGQSLTVMHAKLPKVELRKFHGHPIEWYPFWESFKSAVHKNPNLSGVDKFNYLKSHLWGLRKMLSPVLRLRVQIMERRLICFRFGNRQVVISSHMEALTRIPMIT